MLFCYTYHLKVLFRLLRNRCDVISSIVSILLKLKYQIFKKFKKKMYFQNLSILILVQNFQKSIRLAKIHACKRFWSNISFYKCFCNFTFILFPIKTNTTFKNAIFVCFRCQYEVYEQKKRDLKQNNFLYSETK